MKSKVICPITLLFLCAGVFAQEVKKEEAFEERVERMKKEVVWVNPDIKEMPGLSHTIMHSTRMGHDVGFSVWTPPGYSEAPEVSYPVIYFLHGMGGNEARDAAGFSSWVEKAISKNLLPPVICVFPNGGMSGYKGKVETFIVEELIPTIDAEYRTIASQSSRALAGFSMGGSGSVYLSIMHPELFCAAGSMGGGLRLNKAQLDAGLEKAVPVWKAHNYGFFLCNGDNDRPEAFEDFSESLDENQIKYQVLVIEDTPHKLGLYYERSVLQLLEFLGSHISEL